MLADVFSSLSAEQVTGILIVGMIAVAGTVIAVVSIVCSSWGRARAIGTRAELTRLMVERGVSPDEIARVLAQQGHDLRDEPLRLPCACEAVVESDGEWSSALVLQVADGRYLVHFVGQDMDENEWVGEDRVRFPAGSRLPGLMTALGEGRPGSNGAPGKPLAEMEV
ncbi:MAG: hypothetical protein AB7I30_13760 [Isosphaeraceae bacterium]